MDQINIGDTAFMLVCAGVWIMRNRRPDLPRGFVVPALPVVAKKSSMQCLLWTAN